MFVPGHVLVVLAAALTCARAELDLCGNKYCGLGAVCNGDNKCECPLSQPLGDPALRCHGDETVSCVLIGDPVLRGFTGDLTFLESACKYTFTKFDTPLLSRASNTDPAADWNTADPGNDRCRVIIHGTNAASERGTYYLHNVEVLVTFNIGGSSHLDTLIVKMGSEKATFSYAPYSEQIVEKTDEHGCLPRILDAVNSIAILVCYTEESMVWSFGIPICGSTYVIFRAWQGISENQPHRPGVAITTNGNTALFSRNSNGYPETMCDNPFNDADDVYHESCKKRGIIGKRNCAFHALLTNNPPEQPHYCMASIELFNACPADLKVPAINACGSIVTQLGKCVKKNDQDIYNTFEACLAAVCGNPAMCSKIREFIHHGDDEECNSFKDPC